MTISKKRGNPMWIDRDADRKTSSRGGMVRLIMKASGSLAVGVLAAGTLAACTSSASTSAGRAHKTAQANGTSHSNLDSLLASIEGTPRFTAPGPPIQASALRGSQIVAIDCAPSAAPPANTTTGLVAAAKVAGIKVTVLAGGNETLSLDLQFFDQALARKPRAIVTIGCVSGLLGVPMAAAKAAHIPVIVSDNMGPTPSAPGQGAGPLAFGIANQPMTEEGMIAAEYIASTGPPNAQVGFVTADEVAGSPQVYAGFKSELKKVCPQCSIAAVQNVNPGAWTTSLSSTISSMLASNPKIDYLVPVFDGMAPFVSTALSSSGKVGKVKVVTTQGSTGPALNAVKSGTFAADVGTSNTWVGWVALDQAMRGALDLPAERNPIIPVRLFTKKVMASVNPSSDSSSYGTSYVQGFRKLWGIS